MKGNSESNATTSPDAVATSASPIPPEIARGSTIAPPPPSNSKLRMIPVTVPRMPSIGAAVMMVESVAIQRSIRMRSVSTEPTATASLAPSLRSAVATREYTVSLVPANASTRARSPRRNDSMSNTNPRLAPGPFCLNQKTPRSKDTATETTLRMKSGHMTGPPRCISAKNDSIMVGGDRGRGGERRIIRSSVHSAE